MGAMVVALSAGLGWLVAYATGPKTSSGSSGTQIAQAPGPPSTTTSTAIDPVAATTPPANTTVSTDAAPATTATTTAAATTTTTDATTKVKTKTKKASAVHKPQRLRVRLDASAAPTFLCVDDAHGNQLFGGTLSGVKTFSAPHLRFNIGLSTTRVTVNGKDVALSGSPVGLSITLGHGVQPLPLGSRPCA